MIRDDAILRTAGLRKVFRDFWLRSKVTAVADLDLEVRPGEVFGLLGPNGSGKSTTLKMILGLLFPTKGTIGLFGKPPSNVRVKERIGFLPEESNLYAFLDARETLDYYGRLFKLPRDQRHRRIDMLIEMVGLGAAAWRRVGEYSKGMQRRIGLAQALINDPDLLILDEPTSGLDPLGTRQFKDLIRALAERGKTVLLSSHLLADVEDVCDRVCVLYGGRKRAEGSVEELLARQHQTQIVADDLDEATLNAVRELLTTQGHELLEVTRPRQKLETLFLNIIEDARRQNLATGGAVEGQVAEFLTAAGEEQGQAVIDRLVQQVQPPPAQTGAEPSPPAEAPPADRAVLDELVSPDSTTSEETPGEATRAESSPAEPDRSVLDNLLQSGQSEQDGQDKDKRDDHA
jgi:ABC-2 type transport system ATP-binding protein